MPVQGLDALRRQLQALPAQASRAVVKACAQEARVLVEEGFEDSHAPDGAPWAPLKARQGQPLRDTGRLMASLTPTETATGFFIDTNVVYAPFQQNGTSRIPARPFLPEGEAPGPWVERLEEAAEDAIDAIGEKL